MQIVIDIPYGHYLTIKDGFLNECIKSTTEAIVNGIILPKGHGRLIDVDTIVYEKECVYFSDGSCTTESTPDISATPTIIEADKEQEDE